MTRTYARSMTALFCLFFGGLFILLLLLPKSDFSPNENRPLAAFPSIRADGLLSGTYMAEVDAFLTDHFPFRESFVTLKARAELTAGKGENNGIYLGLEDTLIPRFDPPDQRRVNQNFDYVDAFAVNAAVPVHFALVPGKAGVWADRLPDGAPNADELVYLERGMGSVARWSAVYSALMTRRDEEIFFRTDHHWTARGAYYAYAVILSDMGIPPLPLSVYAETVVADDFFGTAWSSSGARWVAPDPVSFFVPDDGVTVTGFHGDEAVPGSLYVEEKLAEKDKYQYFLGGVQPRCVVSTARTDGPKLLVVRDSFADAMVPFLTPHFSEVHLIDPRYYKSSLHAYIAEQGIDLALVLYSVANFTTDGNIFLLGVE